MMRSYFRILTGQNFTVDQVVQEAYSLATPGTTGTEDATRRAGARKALRAANPGLPAADNVNITGFTHLWLRRITRIPFRIPATTPAALRAELANNKIHDVWKLCSMSATFVKNLPGVTATQPQVDRLLGICRLLKVKGMPVGGAIALYDDTTNPITSVEALRDASQGTVKAILYAADPTMPVALKDLRPAYRLQRGARRHAPRPSRGQAPRFVGAFSDRVLSKELAYWVDEFRNPVRSQAERVSASVIAVLLEIQREISIGNARWAKGDGARAYMHLRRIWTLMGAAAVRYGIVAGGTADASGPSLQTILTTCGAMLAQIEPSDAELSRRRLDVAMERVGEGARGFTMNELIAGSKTTLRAALDSKEIWVLNRIRRRRALALLSDKKRSDLGAGPFVAGLESTNTAIRVMDFRTKDREILLENLGAATVLQYRTQFASEWTTLEGEVEVSDLKDAVGAALVGNGNVHVGAAGYPSSLLTNLTPYDRFFAYRPMRRPNAPAVFVPLNANFASRYRLDVLVPLRDERLNDVWMFGRGDFADPARFCFILPALMARPLRVALARTSNPSNDYTHVVNQEKAIGKETAALATTAPTTTLEASASVGALEPIGGGYVHELLQTIVEDLVKNGDEAYQAGRVERARKQYQQALDEVRADPTFGYLAERVPMMHTQMVTTIDAQVSADLAPSVTVAEFYVDNPTTETGTSLFPGLYTAKPLQEDVSKRSASRVSTAESVAFYFNGITPQTLTPPEVFKSEGIPTFDQQDDDEWDDVLVPAERTGNVPPTTGPAPAPEEPKQKSGKNATLKAQEADALEALMLASSMQMAKIDAGFNWLGLDPDAAPPWRFDHLLGQARYFGEKADALQQRAFSMLQAMEQREIVEDQAESAQELAEAGVEVANAQVALAEAQVDLAKEQRESAKLAWDHSKDDKWWRAVGGACVIVAAGFGAVAGVVGAPFTAGTSLGVTALSIAAVAGGGASALGAVEGFERSLEAQGEAKAQWEVAQAQVAVASQQVAVAEEERALATLQESTAKDFLALLGGQELTSAGYQELLTFVGTLAQSYLLMANRLGFLAERAYELESRRRGSYVRQDYGAADTLEGRFQSGAQLLAALDGLAHERVTSTVERYQTIKTTFSLMGHQPSALWQFQNGGATLVRVRQKDVDLRFPGLYLHGLKRVEVEFDGLLPAEGVHAVLRIANNGFVRVPNDAAYVGNPNNVKHDWAYPAVAWRIGDAPGAVQPKAAFVQKPLLGVGLTQILSEYRRSQDTVVLAPPDGALDVFENLSTDLTLTLEMPKTGNRFDFLQISDVRLSLYFTAHTSEALRVRQREQLVANGRASLSRAFLASTDAADALAVFRARPSDPKRYDVRWLWFDVGADALAAHTAERIIQNFQLALLGLVGASLKVRVCATAFPLPTGAAGNSALVETTRASVPTPSTGVPSHVPDGMVFTALGETTVVIDPGPPVVSYVSRANTYPFLEALVSGVAADVPQNHDNALGRYVLKIVPDANTVVHQRNDDGVVISTAATEVALTAGATLTSTAGPWWHGETRVLATLVPPASSGANPSRFGVFQRLEGSNANLVGAEILVLNTGGVLTMRVRLVTGATPVELGPVTSYAVYATDYFATPFELGLRVFGQTAELYLDGVLALTRTLPAAPTAPGKVGVGCAFNPTPNRVLQVRHQRLRFDGAPLDTVLDEPFDTLANWTVVGTASLVAVNRQTLDLSFLQDVLLQLDYTARWDL